MKDQRNRIYAVNKLLIILGFCTLSPFGIALAGPPLHKASLRSVPEPRWKLLWQTRLGHSSTDLFWNDPPAAKPVEAEGTLLVPTAQGRYWTGLTAIASTGGRLLWSIPLASVADLVPDGHGHVFCSSPQGIAKLDIHTGRILSNWQPDVGLGESNYAGRPGPGYLVLAGSVLVAFWDYGRVAGISSETGAVLWVKHWWPEPGRLFGMDQPFAVQDKVFFADCVDACVRAVKAETGDVIWTRSYPKNQDAPENTFTAQPSAIADTMVLIPARDRLDLVRADDGVLLKRVSRAHYPTFPVPLVAWSSGLVEYNNEGFSVVRLLPTMRLSPAKLPANYADARPAADGTILYALDNDAVSALDFRTGKHVNLCHMTTNLSSVIVVGQQAIFVVTTAGEVSALPRLRTSKQ